MSVKANNKGFVEFTRGMKRTHKILVPDILPLHLDLLSAVFKKSGYNLQVLTNHDKKILSSSLLSIHNDMCYPLICTAGQGLEALKSGEYPLDKVALIQFQTGGGCRASNYIHLLRRALKIEGLEKVPVISLSFNGLEKHSGFKLTPRLLMRSLCALIYGDMLMLLKNQCQPYEVTKGESEALVLKWIKNLNADIKCNFRLFGNTLSSNLKKIVTSFKNIKRTNEKKVKVGIIGEIYVKYSPFGNNELEKFLLSQDCEIMVPGVFAFVEYCFYNRIMDYQSYRNISRPKMLAFKNILGFCKKLETKFVTALQGSGFCIPEKFDELIKGASACFDTHIEMGEGWLLPSEAVELARKGYKYIVSAQPFGCLPNHIVARGFAKKFKSLFPDSYLCPIDYDASQSAVNQENRIRLMLSIARDELKANEVKSNSLQSQSIVNSAKNLDAVNTSTTNQNAFTTPQNLAKSEVQGVC